MHCMHCMVRIQFREPPLVKESVFPKRKNIVGRMPECMIRRSVGVQRRHPVTILKASFKHGLRNEYERCDIGLARR